MTVTNTHSGTNLYEIADGIYRINTPVPRFSFNQYLILDDAPLLFHTGPRKMFQLVREAVAKVVPVESLWYRSKIWQTGPRRLLRMERFCLLEDTRSGGLIHRTCHMRGSVAT
jgi:hypothetical protein